MNSLFKFPCRVRIHGGGCGAVARALHHKARIHSLPAVEGKVSFTTHERKVMSKSTFFKRISLAVVAALAFGAFSSAPSQAVITSSSVSFDADDTVVLAGSTADSATAVLTQTFGATNTAGDSATVYVNITSANAGYATLSMRNTDSSTNVQTVAGTQNTSACITYANTGCVAGGGVYSTYNSTNNLETGTTSAYSGTGYTRNDSRTVSLFTAPTAASATVKYSVKLAGISKTGTYTVTASVINYTGGSGAASTVSATATWTVTVTGPSNAVTAASVVRMARGTARPGIADSTVVSAATAYTQAANIWIDQKNSAGSALNGDRDTPAATSLAQGESVTATISGQGFITAGATSTGTAPTAATAVKTVTAASVQYLHIWSDGTAGTGTVTLTTGSGLSLGTKTFTFFGTRTAIKVVDSNWTVGRAGTGSVGYTTGSTAPTASTPAAFTVKVTDAAGTGSTAGTVDVTSSNTAVIASASCVAHSDLNAYSGAGIGGYNCEYTTAATAKSGDKATLTFRVTDPAATNAAGYFTATAEVTVGGTVSTETAAFDKATYGPGDKMVLTLTGKDASGNPVYDGAAAASLTCNKTIGGSLADSEWGAYVGGKLVAGNNSYESLFAPASGGAFKCSGNGGASGLSIITAEASVTDSTIAAVEAAQDAAAEAIDAANAATDAANLAAEAADAATVAAEEARDAADAATAAVEELATQVATLMAALKAQITTLANTVAKIAKKVKA